MRMHMDSDVDEGPQCCCRLSWTTYSVRCTGKTFSSDAETEIDGQYDPFHPYILETKPKCSTEVSAGHIDKFSMIAILT
ncbi:hypothetical protein Tco_0428029 [Tanacetum coccineum]